MNLAGMISMKNLKSLLTSIAFALAGIAVHANAATESRRGESGICFQQTPPGRKNDLPRPAEEGSGSDPLD
ncbi:hypothetical protein D9M69_661270 [compost metagenome]